VAQRPPDLISGENSAAALLAKIKAEKENARKKKKINLKFSLAKLAQYSISQVQ